MNTLSLCDLAGSERTSRTQSGGDRLREAGWSSSTHNALRLFFAIDTGNGGKIGK